MARPVSFRWDEEFVARIDRARKTRLGEISRSAFVRDAVDLQIRHEEAVRAMAEDPTGEHSRRAVERALSEANGPSNIEQSGPGTVPSSEGVRSAAPAEQPEIDAGFAQAARQDAVTRSIQSYSGPVSKDPTQAPVRRVSPSRPASPRVPSPEMLATPEIIDRAERSGVYGPPRRRDVKPFQRGES